MLRTSPAPAGSTLPDESARQIVRALADLISLVEPRLIELWTSAGVTFSQRRLLRRLAAGPRSAGDLAGELRVAAPTVTRQLQKLEDRGLLTRQVDTADRRRVLVALTDAGSQLLADHRVLGGGPVALATSGLTASERRALARSLAVLARAARDHEEAIHERE